MKTNQQRTLLYHFHRASHFHFKVDYKLKPSTSCRAYLAEEGETVGRNGVVVDVVDGIGQGDCVNALRKILDAHRLEQETKADQNSNRRLYRGETRLANPISSHF